MRLNREIRLIFKRALREDIGREDITTLFTIPYHFKTESIIIAKEAGVLCGLEIARAVFKERGGSLDFKAFKKDGDVFMNNEKIALIKGDARLILSAERVALNFLSLLSGIATVTRKFVDKTKGTKAKILDTRKTTPNLRILEKYAVKTGGGLNHRQTLVDAILIKDNHLRAGRFLNQGKLDEERLGKCIRHLRNLPTVKIEIEVETLDEFKAILKYKPHVVMLDNFIPSQIREAVKFRNQHFPKIKLEASGGISMENVKEIAEAGVDFISIGSLTHSPKAIDFSLEIIEHR